jgi:magnesium chelatase subunit I
MIVFRGATYSNYQSDVLTESERPLYHLSKPAVRDLIMRKQSDEKRNSSALETRAYPFAAIVGQEEMKLALMLSAIDPHIGGVIVMGHRGTGKSTAVRALANLLPTISKVKGCLFGCDPKRPSEFCDQCRAKLSSSHRLPVERGAVPVVDLPLGATEDRVCGTLDIERALTEGVKAFEPGLLARANRGFLYIDEVNLLDDHLVDVLLDSAASGRNVVEREGISISHPARFVLVGSGNPEEGELRPQLLDRFGLYTQITTITDLDQRVEIVERRERFERDAESFFESFRGEEEILRQRLVRAKKTHSRVQIDRGLLRLIAELCIRLEVDGHRGELTIARASRALAALGARTIATADDVKRVAAMSLRHRMRKDPLERIDSDLRIEQAIETVFPSKEPDTRLVAVR